MSNEKKDTYGQTPLHYAVMANDLKAVQRVTFKKIDLDAVDSHGVAPIHYLMGSRIGDSMRVKIDILVHLVGCGANINITDAIGQTPLHLALIAGHEEIVKLLINWGAKLDIMDMLNQTPLKLAKKYKMKDVVTQMEEVTFR